MGVLSRTLGAAALALVGGCASAIERSNAEALARVEPTIEPLGVEWVGDTRREPGGDLDGSLDAYVAHALARSPTLRARFDEWRAASHAPRAARRFPDLMVSYAGCIVGAERCVGPMGQRVGVMQWFPWPTTLSAASDAEAYLALAAQRRFEAEALAISAAVARAYWRLWAVRASREVQRAQIEVVRGLSELVRVRVETGAVSLGALAQIDLTIARQEDRLVSLDAREREASAALAEVIGEAGIETPTRAEPPSPSTPAEPLSALQEAIGEHPRVTEIELWASASGERARAVGAHRFPSLGLGADWIIGRQATATTPQAMHMLMISASLKIPLSVGAIRADRARAEAEGAAHNARALAARQRAYAALEEALAAVEDSRRRTVLYRSTLLPQAETAFGALQGAYQAGEVGLADILLAERDLLDLELAEIDVQAEHAIAWATLDEVVGRPVARGDGR
ncbi:MAG: TolC family protein [Myxococcales bacterium]|nr:TolC family protein [Myxococcales bacterium]